MIEKVFFSKAISKTKKLSRSLISSIYLPAILALSFLLLLFFLAPQKIEPLLESAADRLFEIFADFYLWLASALLVVFILIGSSPLGKIKIGGEDAKPRYSLFSWFSMLFCTGMGGGILFWGTAEPLGFYFDSPLVKASQLISQEAIAFEFAFLHWGLHGWAIYGMTALAICFFTMNLGKNLSFSSFVPLKFIPEGKARKSLSRVIDLSVILAIFFGIITSFSLSIISITSGLGFIFKIESTYSLRILIVLIVTTLYLSSSLTGLSKGIKLISNLSILLSLLLLICTFIKIPFSSLASPIFEGFPAYFKNIVPLSLGLLEYQERDFLVDWTVKYWGWWFAWAPFVGIFVALISRGRTVRELVFFVLFAPSAVTIIWFAVFGEAAIQVFSSLKNPQSLFDPNNNIYLTLYELFSSVFFPTLALILTFMFFINSADSATYTMGSLTDESKDQVRFSQTGDPYLKEPSSTSRIFWGLSFSVVSILLLSIGGIGFLKSTVSLFVFPFTILLVFVFTNLIVRMVSYYQDFQRREQK